MKKLNLFSILLILSMVFLMPTAYAHDITVSNKIGIENVGGTIYSGSKISVDDSIGEHTIYYQYVQLSNDVYKSYAKKHTEESEWIKTFLEENNLDSINDITGDLIAEFNETVSVYEAEKEELLPGYQEGKWIESVDATAKLDLTKVPSNELGFQPYVLWIKVEPNAANAASIYNDIVVRAKQEQNVTTENPDEDNEANANTGDEIIYIGIAVVALAGIAVVSYKKSHA